MRTYSYLKLWLPVIIWCSVIFYLSGIPNLSSGLERPLDMVLRKGAHLVEYAVLTFLLWRALSNSFKIDLVWLYSLSAGISILYAISDEIHQSFVPTRGPRVMDVLIDSIGAVIALWLIMRRNRNSGLSIRTHSTPGIIRNRCK